MCGFCCDKSGGLRVDARLRVGALLDPELIPPISKSIHVDEPQNGQRSRNKNETQWKAADGSDDKRDRLRFDGSKENNDAKVFKQPLLSDRQQHIGSPGWRQGRLRHFTMLDCTVRLHEYATENVQ